MTWNKQTTEFDTSTTLSW